MVLTKSSPQLISNEANLTGWVNQVRGLLIKFHILFGNFLHSDWKMLVFRDRHSEVIYLIMVFYSFTLIKPTHT